jgi:dihydrofolate reductase
MDLTAIVAATPAGIIGYQGRIPWQIRSDLLRFKRLTLGHHLVMGRQTFESIGRPLPGRQSIVVTRQAAWDHAGVDTVNSPEAAIRRLAGKRAFVIGGSAIYEALWPFCSTVMLTRVWANVEGDVSLPAVDWSEFRTTYVERLPASARDEFPSEFVVYRRMAIPRAAA